MEKINKILEYCKAEFGHKTAPIFIDKEYRIRFLGWGNIEITERIGLCLRIIADFSDMRDLIITGSFNGELYHF